MQNNQYDDYDNDDDDNDNDNDVEDVYSSNSVYFQARTSTFFKEIGQDNIYNMIMMEMTIMILMMIMIMMKMIIAVIQSIFKLGPKICLKYEVDEDKQSTHSRLQGKLPKTQTNKY